MSHAPVNIRAEQAQSRPYGRQGAWQMMRECGIFTVGTLRQRLPHMSKDSLARYVQALCKGGYLERRGLVHEPASLGGRMQQYALVRDVGVEAPRLDKKGTALPATGQQNMWLALKILGAVTPAELAAHASTQETAVTESAACSYLRYLQAAGYLAVVSRAGLATYRLIKDTGGFAPMIQRTKVVFDPNLQKIMWHEDIEP